MADYPETLHTWDNVEDEVTTIDDGHMNDAHAEIIAIEQEQIDFRSRFYAYKPSAWQGITAGAWRTIQFQSELYDEKGEFDSSSLFRFVPENSGHYAFEAGIKWDSYEDGKYVAMCFYRSGGRFGEVSKIYYTNSGQGQSISAQFDVSDIQYVDVRIFTNNASSKNIVQGYSNTYFSGHRLS